MAKYDVARLDELDGVVKKVRRALSVTAFGVTCQASSRLTRGSAIRPTWGRSWLPITRRTLGLVQAATR